MKTFKNIFCIIFALILVAGSAIPAFALPPAPVDKDGNPLSYTPLQTIEITPAEGEWKYEPYFLNFLNSQYENESFEYYYEEVYEYYRSYDSTETPDYVIVECYKDYVSGEGDYTTKIGEYEIKRYYHHYPYELGYFVFVPENKKIYTLEEAFDTVPDIDKGLQKLHHDPVYEIRCYCGFENLDIPGGGTMPHPTISYLGSEKGAEIYEFIYTSENTYKTTRTVGDWEIISPNPGDYPCFYGIFVYFKSQVYTLDEAFEKGLVTDLNCVNNSYYTIALHKTFYESFDPDNKYDYEKPILSKIKADYIHNESTEITSYYEIYKHYSDASTSDEATPEYVLINLNTNLYYSMPVANIFGDKLLYESSGNIPFTYGYAVYFPENNVILALSEALTRNIKGIEEALNHISYNALMGDNDEDGKLTIKDATYMQKCLASLEEFRKDDVIEGLQYYDNHTARFISDYNRDGERNIKDVTAIQKRLANITV
ncbi:MAG: hypothetical protein IKK10_03055 [Clostridia bacterium]|nr:hypothetical protein [Clostridia bacterium]